jgi:hypothetical protein
VNREFTIHCLTPDVTAFSLGRCEKIRAVFEQAAEIQSN